MAFDISFVYNGEEIQPEKEVSVKFDYKNNTDLPAGPDYKRINEFMMYVNEKVVKGF